MGSFSASYMRLYAVVINHASDLMSLSPLAGVTCVRQTRVQAEPVSHLLLGHVLQEQEMGAVGHAEL